MNPLCFILMPFGTKEDDKGRKIDFDTIYNDLIKPAIEDANMEAVRADEEMVGGFIHKPMFERLLLCDYAIADLTTANANVFYELGVRHTAKPYATLSLFAKDTFLPFDVTPLRSYPYSLNETRELDNIEEDRAYITKWLNNAREPVKDSPLFQFFDEMKPHIISREKTDVFRDRVEYSIVAKKKLAKLRNAKDIEGIKAFEKSLNIVDTEGGVLLDIFLSYRSLSAWGEMISLVEKMPKYLAKSLMVKEQLGLAFNRDGQSKEAERVLLEAIDEYGESGETLGILGRVYKDRWKKETNPLLKESALNLAIETYIKGFNSDSRDAYPGINAITLMSMQKSRDVRFEKILPVVEFAVTRRVKQGNPDYWDYATLMEVLVIAHNKERAREVLLKALPLATEDWMRQTTADTIVMLRDKWRDDGEDVEWLGEFVEGLRYG